MTIKHLPPIDVLRNRVFYNPETGEVRTMSRSATPRPMTSGHIRIGVCGQRYAAHRIAWALHYGELPDTLLEIDHINGDPSDNRISNLRLVTGAENLRNKNKYKNCKHGYSGIIFEKDRVRCWRAQISVNGRNKKLGAFRCKTAAIVARKQGEAKYGFTGRSGDKKWQV